SRAKLLVKGVAMIRIGSVLLEQYRKVVETDYASEEELVAQVMGKPFEPRWQMEAGTAWHSALEDRPELITDGHDGRYGAGDYWFDGKAVTEARELIGPGLWEVKQTRVLDVFGCPVTLVAKVDHIHGRIIQDNKARFGPLDVEGIEPSLQWRAYLWVFQAALVRYNLFEF